MTVPTAVGVETEVPRNQWGHAMLWTPDQLALPEEKRKRSAHVRVTTIAGTLEDRYKIEQARRRRTVRGFLDRKDLALAALTLDPERDREAFNRLCDDAEAAGLGDARANIGTGEHALIAMLNRGLDPPPIPAEWAPDAAAYTAAVEGFTFHEVEPLTVNDRYRYAGSPDMVVSVPMLPGRFIGDVKTGQHVLRYSVRSIAQQMAMYARAHLYDLATGERTEHGADLRWGLLIEVPSGQGVCRLHWLDLLAGWNDVIRLSLPVREYRRSNGGIVAPYTPGRPPSFTATDGELAVTDELLDAILAATSSTALDALWRSHARTFTDAHVAAARRRLGVIRAQHHP